MFIEWNYSYSVGIDEVDEHHKKLLELIDKSYRIRLLSENKEDLSHLLYELINYAHYHFSAEERLMLNYDYPDIARHISEHNAFTNAMIERWPPLFSGGAPDADFSVESRAVFCVKRLTPGPRPNRHSEGEIVTARLMSVEAGGGHAAIRLRTCFVWPILAQARG